MLCFVLRTKNFVVGYVSL